MMHKIIPITSTVISVLISGCAALIPPPPRIPSIPPAPEIRINHTIPSQEPAICGELAAFVIDIHKLDGKQRKSLLDELSNYDGSEFSCDRLKTGLVLSQIGKTISEDNLALEIIGNYQQSGQLKYDELQLLQLLNHQSLERKRLHVLLSKLGQKLQDEQVHTETISENLIGLQEKLNQLQKLEADINETEQSISEPTTSNLSTETTENSGS